MTKEESRPHCQFKGSNPGIFGDEKDYESSDSPFHVNSELLSLSSAGCPLIVIHVFPKI